jgi:dimethylaniline monooxygenase (N-oxide forming)
MHQLAAEIGAAPSATALLRRSPRAFLAYALGQAYTSFFRLQGPFESEYAWHTSATELYEPVVSRGLLTNLIFIGTMAVFAWMNLVAHVVETCVGLVAPRWLAKQRKAAGA